VLTDLSSLYADVTGIGSVIAARLAVEDYDATSKGLKVEMGIDRKGDQLGFGFHESACERFAPFDLPFEEIAPVVGRRC
jgi:hypothetical protein